MKSSFLQNFTGYTLLQRWVRFSITILLVAGCTTAGLSIDTEMETVGENTFVINGNLTRCPKKANCVSSEDSDTKYFVAPLEYSGSAPEAWRELQEVITTMGGSIELTTDHFLHATFRSTLFRFVDDVTCRLNIDKNLIHIRSASRTGYSDFGVNKKRVEMIRQLLNTKI